MNNYLCLLLFVSKSLISMQTSQAPHQLISSILDSYVKNQTQQQKFSGSVLIAKKDTILISKSYGLANYELNVPNAPDTKFRIGSITKQFTAFAIMQLQEKGLLNVQDRLSKYLPDFPNGQNITLHQLLTHTSGIYNISTMPDIIEKAKQAITLEKLVTLIKQQKPEFSPGDHYSYNNSGYILLTYIVEKVSGKSYGQYLNENIFKPLKMLNTGVDSPIPIIKNRAAGYSKEGDTLVNAPYTDMAWTQGAGVLYSTVEDLYRWHRALQQGALLSKESLKTLMAAHVPMESSNEYYGYGFWHVKNTQLGSLIGHRGKTVGFHSAYYYYPEHELVIIILSNFMFAPLKDILDEVATIVQKGKQ